MFDTKECFVQMETVLLQAPRQLELFAFNTQLLRCQFDGLGATRLGAGSIQRLEAKRIDE